MIVTTLLLFSTALSISIVFSGCFGCEPQLKKCVTPKVSKPEISNKFYEDSFGGAKQCAMNYYAMKKYAELLEEANKVCR
jgi:hypothetical protein